jgi:hypothetical protein
LKQLQERNVFFRRAEENVASTARDQGCASTELRSVHSIDERHKRMLPVPGSWFPVDKENVSSEKTTRASSAFGRKDHPPRHRSPPLQGGDLAIGAKDRRQCINSHPAEGGTACGGVGDLRHLKSVNCFP